MSSVLHAPDLWILLYAVLDESTSQVSEPVERTIFEELRSEEVATLSIAHRRHSLLAFHQLELQLLGQPKTGEDVSSDAGCWRLVPIDSPLNCDST